MSTLFFHSVDSIAILRAGSLNPSTFQVRRRSVRPLVILTSSKVFTSAGDSICGLGGRWVSVASFTIGFGDFFILVWPCGREGWCRDFRAIGTVVGFRESATFGSEMLCSPDDIRDGSNRVSRALGSSVGSVVCLDTAAGVTCSTMCCSAAPLWELSVGVFFWFVNRNKELTTKFSGGERRGVLRSIIIIESGD